MRREEGPGESHGLLRNEQPGSGAPQGHIFRKRLQYMGSSPTWKFKMTETHTVRCAPQERCWRHLQCSWGQWKGSWACGLGPSRAAVREKGAGRRGRGQKKVQVCFSGGGELMASVCSGVGVLKTSRPWGPAGRCLLSSANLTGPWDLGCSGWCIVVGISDRAGGEIQLAVHQPCQGRGILGA